MFPTRARLRRGAARLVLVAATAASAVSAAPAAAVWHDWSCRIYENTRCYDGGYYLWEQVNAHLGFPPPNLCAKAITAAGNIRTGSGCNSGYYNRHSNIAGGSPESTAFVYYGNGGILAFHDIAGSAGTYD